VSPQPGKLEIMSSDNAQREMAIKMEEDRKFLAGLSKEEARQERLARESKEREAREKSEYSAYLSEIMERKKVERRRERETQALVGEQVRFGHLKQRILYFAWILIS